MDIAPTIIALLLKRAPDASICPSEVARALADEPEGWRALMPDVRTVAADMARNGRIVVTQGHSQLDPADIGHGPVRLRRGPAFPEDDQSST